jgi:hypothetical protein
MVGDRCFGEGEGALAMHARRLAAATGVNFLAVRFDSAEGSARLLGGDLRPDISSPEIADAIFENLGRRRGC